MADQGRARYSRAQSGKARYSQVEPGTAKYNAAEKTHHVLYFWKAGALRISNMILRGDYLVTTWGNLGEIMGKSWGNLWKSWRNLGGIMGESVVDNYIIWGILSTMESNPWCHMHLWCHCYLWKAPLSSYDLLCPLMKDLFQFSKIFSLIFFKVDSSNSTIYFAGTKDVTIF